MRLASTSHGLDHRTQMPLKEVIVEVDAGDDTMFNLTYGKESYMLGCSSPGAKEQWIEAIEAAVSPCGYPTCTSNNCSFSPRAAARMLLMQGCGGIALTGTRLDKRQF